jgi:hypothetical protein
MERNFRPFSGLESVCAGVTDVVREARLNKRRAAHRA